MFTTFRTETTTGKSRFHILDFGYRTDKHPKFSTEARAQAYIQQAAQDPAKVSRALAIKAEGDAYRASLKH